MEYHVVIQEMMGCHASSEAEGCGTGVVWRRRGTACCFANAVVAHVCTRGRQRTAVHCYRFVL